MVARLDRLQRRHPAVGVPIAVVYKYVDDAGGYLAALITYYAFVSLLTAAISSATMRCRCSGATSGRHGGSAAARSAS